MAAASTSGHPEWQNTIKERLMASQQSNDAVKEVIEQYRRLSKTARELRIRNRALLKGGGDGEGSSSTPGPLLSHLDAQLSALRAELSTLYRTQAAAQNKQLSMADALRDRDEEVRGLREEVRELRDAKDHAAKRERNWEERWKMRDEDVRTLHDEILSQQIEIAGMSQRNVALQADNASLLQRWLDKMNMTAEEMNDDFEREAKDKGKGKEKDGEGANGHEGFRTGEDKSPSGDDWEVLHAASDKDAGGGLEGSADTLEASDTGEMGDDDEWAEARLASP